MFKALFIMIVLSAVICGVATADDDDNFFTSTVSSVVDKFNKYSSGEKGILVSDNDDYRRADYSQDGLGRKLSEPVTIRTKVVQPKSAADNEESY